MVDLVQFKEGVAVEYRSMDVSMWSGHFERLHGAKIICFGEDEDSLNFN